MMKKIHFNQLKFKKWSSILLIISLIFILFGSFEIIDFGYEKTNRIITSLGFLIQVIFYSKKFFYKNYVEWNKIGMNIRLNKFIGKSIEFDNIKKIELEKNSLKIIEKSGLEKKFEIQNIEDNDVEKLIKIIKQNSGIETNGFSTN